MICLWLEMCFILLLEICFISTLENFFFGTGIMELLYVLEFLIWIWWNKFWSNCYLLLFEKRFYYIYGFSTLKTLWALWLWNYYMFWSFWLEYGQTNFGQIVIFSCWKYVFIICMDLAPWKTPWTQGLWRVHNSNLQFQPILTKF